MIFSVNRCPSVRWQRKVAMARFGKRGCKRLKAIGNEDPVAMIRKKKPQRVRLLILFLTSLALTACGSASVVDVGPEFSPEIDNFILVIGGNVTINEVSHTISANSQAYCPNVPKPRLVAGAPAIQTDTEREPSNLRLRPGTEAGIVAKIEHGKRVFVLLGPICSEGYNWYVVAFGDYLVGWVAEADQDGKTYWFLPDKTQS